MSCIFCKIINGEIPSSKVYEDDEIFEIVKMGMKPFKNVILLLPCEDEEEALSTLVEVIESGFGE